MKKILIVDENKQLINKLKDDLSMYHVLENFEVLEAKTYAELIYLVSEYNNEIAIAVVSKNLPDAKDGKAIMLLSTNNIKTIILYESFDKENKLDNKLLNIQGVIGYFEKSDNIYIDKLVEFIHRKIRNAAYTALVVDDSLVYRERFKEDLKNLNINVLLAKDGKEALNIFKSKKYDISLLITDYNMPNMDGIELVKKVREEYKSDKLFILAISTDTENKTLTKFIKSGANDYIKKPYTIEELAVRIDSNLNTLEMFEKINNLANKDSLTCAYNRRYFFNKAKDIIKRNYKNNKPITVATVDIDKFKNINDTYGHDVGDIAIKEVINILKENSRKSDLLSRFGGEEFCLLLEDISLKETENYFEKIRTIFEKNKIIINDDLNIHFTVSIGVAHKVSKQIDEMIKLSDKALYEAKNSGRNKVVIYE